MGSSKMIMSSKFGMHLLVDDERRAYPYCTVMLCCKDVPLIDWLPVQHSHIITQSVWTEVEPYKFHDS